MPLTFIRNFTRKSMNRYFRTSSYLGGNYTLEHSANAAINKHVGDKYMCLPLPECKMFATYIWIDGSGDHLRCKTKVLNFYPACVDEFPHWGYDANQTGQNVGSHADNMLIPAAVYNDPFRRGKHKLVLCEVYTPEKKPAATNYRTSCSLTLKAAHKDEPMFGMEQEFFLMDVDGRPLGWAPVHGYPKPSGNDFYCGIGAKRCIGRDIMESALRACLYSGIHMNSISHDALPAQWEYQTGPTLGIKAADDLWMARLVVLLDYFRYVYEFLTSRFITERVAEDYGVAVSLKPKMFKDLKGAACHYNFSTNCMRKCGGLAVINNAIAKLNKRHLEHLVKYDPHRGLDNKQRLNGEHDSSDVFEFTEAIGDRSASIRIRNTVFEAGRGYLEDRRPGANSDPYMVIEAIVRTCLLDS